MKIRISLLANLAGQGWTAALNLAAVPFYIHFLGVDAFGLIGLFTVVITIVSIIDAGMTTTLNRELVRFVAGERSADSIRDLLRSVEIGLGAVGVALMIAALGLGPVLAQAWIGPSSIPFATIAFSLTMMIVAAVLRLLEAIYRAALLGLHRPVLMNGLSVISSTTRIAGVLGAFALVGADLRTFFIWQVATGVLTLAAYACATHLCVGRGSRPARFAPAELRGVKGFASGAFGMALLNILLTQADKMLVPRLVSLREVGYYSAAVVIATSVNQIVLPIFHTFYPRLSFLHATEDGEQFAATYLSAATLLAVVAGCPVAVFIGFGHEILFAWTGKVDVANAAAPVLRLLAPGALAFGLYHLPMAALLAAGAQRAAVKAMGLAVALLVPTILAGFYWAGLDGVAAGWSAVLCLNLALGMVATRRCVLPEIAVRQLVGSSFLAIVVATAITALLRLLRLLLIAATDERWRLAVELAIVGGVVLSLTALVAWNRRAVALLRQRRSLHEPN